MKRIYTISDAARATGVSISALKKWINREIIHQIGNQQSEKWTRFNKRDIAILELTRVISNHGFTIKDACTIAYNFSSMQCYKEAMEHDLFWVIENNGDYVMDKWQLHERLSNTAIVLRPKRILEIAWAKL